jgi:hypothetical protein
VAFVSIKVTISCSNLDDLGLDHETQHRVASTHFVDSLIAENSLSTWMSRENTENINSKEIMLEIKGQSCGYKGLNDEYFKEYFEGNRQSPLWFLQAFTVEFDSRWKGKILIGFLQESMVFNQNPIRILLFHFESIPTVQACSISANSATVNHHSMWF